VVLWHGTFTINSLAHVWGARRYPTTDDSRNNPLLAILTLGEGWHNNHHHYQRSARQGFYWWEVDLSFYVLKLLEACHIVWDVQGVPRHVRDQTAAPAAGMILLAPMTDPTLSTDDEVVDAAAMRALLDGAATASVEAGVDLDDFMRAAWQAYTAARPGLRDALERDAMRARLDELRARGQLALA
jgi:hypothetical protein